MAEVDVVAVPSAEAVGQPQVIFIRNRTSSALEVKAPKQTITVSLR